MSTRRSVLSGAVALMGTGAAAAAPPPHPAGAQPSAATPAEAASGVTPKFPEYAPGDVRRYGIVPNDPAAAGANTNALKALVAPAGAFSGTVWFPNTTGKDTYHLNDIVCFHEGIQLDLQGCTLHFSKPGERRDTNAGFIFALRDFSISNGSIVVDYQRGGGGTDAGNALTFGKRGEDGSYFGPIYDSKLPVPMGNITVRNLRITVNTRGGIGILMFGGLNGVILENVWLDGQGALDYGIYYEFGWATDEPRRELRQTSHAYNLRFSNINIINVGFLAVGLTGAYNCWVDGLYVRSSKVVLGCSPGESAFFRPWKGIDQVGAKRNITVCNLVGVDVRGTGIGLAGASSKEGGYLHVTANTPRDQTDLVDFCIDGFALDGGESGGFGIQSSAEKMTVRNGHITNFVRGIAATHDCTRMTIDSVDIFSCKEEALQLGQDSSIWNPPRQKMGIVRNCFIAGNSLSRPGVYGAVQIDLCTGFIIEGNRFGYELGHDGVAETTQGPALDLGARARNVVCRCNHIAGLGPGAMAYKNRGNSGQGNTVEHPSGESSTYGPWDVLKR